MRGYMARRCDAELPLAEKLRAFLRLSLSAYRVPAEEQAGVIAFMESLDIRAIAQQIMQSLFRALEMRFAFTLDESMESSEAMECPNSRKP